MKKYFSVLILILITCGGLSGIKYGVKGGLNIANISNLTFINKDLVALNGDDYYMMDPDFSIGLYTSFGLTDTLDFQTEVLFSSKSVKFQFSGDTSVTYGVAYFEVPFFLKYTLRLKNRSLLPFLYGGIYYSAFLNSDSKIVNNGEAENVSEGLNIIDDIGIVFGIGTELKLKKNSLILDLRYTFGTRWVFNKTSDEKIKTIYFMIGYEFSTLRRD